jgi:2,4-dienoyl-CoA reductase-like NADH-dependent reductase (Old Yellow Enzyme family)
VFLQIHHAGRQSNSSLINGNQIVAPSNVAYAVVGEEPRELTTAEVKELVNKFVQSAVRCKQAGIHLLVDEKDDSKFFSRILESSFLILH